MEKNNYLGMTIVEMMIAIAIFTIGITGFTQLFVNSWKNNHFVFEMGQTSATVSQGLSTIGDYIKRVRQGDNGAYPIILARDNELTVYCDYNKDGTTERLHFYKEAYTYNGNSFYRIMMGIRIPSTTLPKTYASGDASVVTVINNIMNDTSTPIFYYFDRNYAGASGQLALSTPANITDVRLVKVYLKINIDPNRAPDNIEMQSFNEMRNLNDYDRIH